MSAILILYYLRISSLLMGYITWSVTTEKEYFALLLSGEKIGFHQYPAVLFTDCWQLVNVSWTKTHSKLKTCQFWTENCIACEPDDCRPSAVLSWCQPYTFWWVIIIKIPLLSVSYMYSYKIRKTITSAFYLTLNWCLECTHYVLTLCTVLILASYVCLCMCIALMW